MTTLEGVWTLGTIACIVFSAMIATDPPRDTPPIFSLFFLGLGFGSAATLAMEILSRHLLWQ